MENSFYRKYNLLIVIASFTFLQYYLSHFMRYASQWNLKAWILLPIAFMSGCAVLDFINRARFSYVEQEKEKYVSLILKQMKLPLNEALDDMVNNKAHLDNSGKHIQPYYKKLQNLSEIMTKNIID